VDQTPGMVNYTPARGTGAQSLRVLFLSDKRNDADEFVAVSLL
jgi:hypothetical protein